MIKGGDFKVGVIGAGSVGSTLAMRVIESGAADVVLVDVVEGLALGKAYDIRDAAAVTGHDRKIEGGSDYGIIKGSDIVVITAGLPRKPGMTREDLIEKNSATIRSVTENVRRYSPEAVLIVVTNPLDVMTYLALKLSGFNPRRVMGMAGVLDSARCDNVVAQELGVDRNEIATIVMGSHGDTMVPVLSRSVMHGKPLRTVIDGKQADNIIRRTKDRGAEVVSLLKSGSAYFAPSAACLSMIRAILRNERVTLCVSAHLNGEYGLRDICIGVPCVIGRQGIEKVVELDLNVDEKAAFLSSAEGIAASIRGLDTSLGPRA